MGTQREKGRRAEELCARYLRGRGYEIVEMNYACRGGEIDVIARKDGYLAFVEVKERADRRFGEAREAVTFAKQAKLRLAAQTWLSEHETGLQPRFDVVEIYPGRTALAINHIENAFE